MKQLLTHFLRLHLLLRPSQYFIIYLHLCTTRGRNILKLIENVMSTLFVGERYSDN